MANRCVASDGEDAGNETIDVPVVRDVAEPFDAADAAADAATDAAADAAADAAQDAVQVADAGPDTPDASGTTIIDIVEEGGTGTNVDWFRGVLEIETSPGEATFESAIVDARYEAEWTRFEWTPKGAYGRPFREAEEPSYENGNVDAIALTMLVPFDAPLGAVTTTSYDDISAAGRNGTVRNPADAESVEGIFQTAFRAMGDAEFSVPMSDGLFPPNGPHSVSFWARTAARSTFIEADAGSVVARSIIWVRSEGFSPWCPGEMEVVWTPHAVPFEPVCVSSNVHDDEWHHYVVRKTAEADVGRVELWLDSSVVADFALNFANRDFGYTSLHTLDFASWIADVQLDESMVFARALSDVEIEQLHARGRLNAGFEIRTCDMPDCSDGTFTNLEGGAGLSVDDPRFTSLPITYDMNHRGRYAQIRVTMSSTFAGMTPELESMRLFAE